MRIATTFRVALATLFFHAGFAAENPAVETKTEAATQVYVRTEPPGATVRVDGKDEGRAPGIFVVPPGVKKLTVEVELDGAKESRIVEVRGGRISRVEFEFGKSRACTTDESAADLLANGSFELPQRKGLTYSTRPDFLPGWDLEAGTNGFFLEHGPPCNRFYEGAQSIGLNGDGTQDVSISQRFVAEPGRLYVLRFALASEQVQGGGGAASCPPSRTTVQVDVGDVSQSFSRHLDEGWVVKEVPFRASSSGTTILRITDTTPASHNLESPMIDAVSVVAAKVRESQPSAGTRRFVRLVIGSDAVAFEGSIVGWKEIPMRLEAVPDRSQTVLEVAAESAELPLARMNEVVARLQPLVHELGFQHLSMVGIHPLHSKGSQPVPMEAKCAWRGRVDFRLAPTREEGRSLGLTESEIEHRKTEFEAKGPHGTPEDGQSFVWRRVAKSVTPSEQHIKADHGGRTYVLLSNRPAETMLTLFGDPKPWRVSNVALTGMDEAGLGHPSIALQLDWEGGERMGTLTQTHVGSSMAVIVDDETLSFAQIRSKATQAIAITGAFPWEEARELVECLENGISR